MQRPSRCKGALGAVLTTAPNSGKGATKGQLMRFVDVGLVPQPAGPRKKKR
jgi:hypothetical protein